MKFRVGQKVRVKENPVRPDRISNMYIMVPFGGTEAIIQRINEGVTRHMKHTAYEVEITIEGELMYDYLFFECELESLIKVGEQLEFDFMD